MSDRVYGNLGSVVVEARHADSWGPRHISLGVLVGAATRLIFRTTILHNHPRDPFTLKGFLCFVSRGATAIAIFMLVTGLVTVNGSKKRSRNPQMVQVSTGMVTATGN